MTTSMTPTPAPNVPGGATLATFRDQFIDWLNRDDISVQNANNLITRAISRLNIELRVPFMEREIDFTVTGGASASGFSTFSLPDDFLEFRTCAVDGVPAFPTTYERWLSLPNNPGRGAHFARFGGAVVVKPAAATTLSVVYYGAFPMVVNDSDTCLAFSQLPNLVMWAALSAAGDMYGLTDQKTQWEAMYQRDLTAANQLAIRIDRLGGSTAVGPVKGYAV